MFECECQPRAAGGPLWREGVPPSIAPRGASIERTRRKAGERDASAGAGVRRVAVALLAATWLAIPTFGAAQGFVAKDDKEPPKKRAAEETVVKTEQVTLEDAVAIVRQAHGGRLVSAKSVRRPTPGYRIRIDVDGRVKSLFVDAQGRMSMQ